MPAGMTALSPKADVNPDLATSPWCQKPFPCYSSLQPREAREVAAGCARARGKRAKWADGCKGGKTWKRSSTIRERTNLKRHRKSSRACCARHCKRKRGAIVDDFNIRVFRTKAGLPDWDAEILGEKRVVEDDVKAIFASTTLDLQRQFGLAAWCPRPATQISILREGFASQLPPDNILTSRYRYSWPSKNDFTSTRSSLPCTRTSSTSPASPEWP